MKDFLIYSEKPKAAARFCKYLGGTSNPRYYGGKRVNSDGTFMGKTFHIEPAHGYLMGYRPPEQQVKPELKKQYASWKSMIPWNQDDIGWLETYLKGRNPKTHRIASDKKDVLRIGRAAMHCKNIAVFSDNDPSGAGDDLAMRTIRRIIKLFHWKGNIYRGRFKSDTVPAHVQSAMAHIIRNPQYWLMSPNNPIQWGIFQKGLARSRWDYMSMQITRFCTTFAREHGYNTVVNEGRLKSVILWKIYDQLLKIKNYHRVPYYEVRFKDDNGHIYSRKASSKSHPSFRHVNDMSATKQDMAQYHPSKPVGTQSTIKHSAPGTLLNLSALASKLAPKGYSATQVQNTYQDLYEAGYVSYPRTADKKITQGDFDELLPHVNAIAKVVGVNPALLTHRTLRKKYRVDQEDHGANRPGIDVPKSMNYLNQRFGRCGAAIYSTLAKNYLAILCEDYVYKKTTAHLADYPTFTTSFNEPVKMNYKLVFDNSSSKSSKGTKPIGSMANPLIHTGANPKPTQPTQDWVTNYLNKHNVGTGATQLGTEAQLTHRGKNQKIKSRRGKYSLTQSGLICAVMVRGTYIASTKVTKRLFSFMDGVAKQKYSIHQCVDTATQLIKHDQPIMERNAGDLMSAVGTPTKQNQSFTPKEKVQIQFNGQPVKINRKFGGHRLTDDEVQKLSSIKEGLSQKDALTQNQFIVLPQTSKRGRSYKIKANVTKQSYGGHDFYGINRLCYGDAIGATINGKFYVFPPRFMGAPANADEIKQIVAGQQVTFTRKGSKGDYKAIGEFSPKAYKGKPGIKLVKFVD